ncbi:hypothetical protein D9619_010282 [Psilocybe cf. subviscida]|uniref:Uncharacterized protein n=1 Tax=Psilocybe cf. subviscida TaxID=2480587 RepID=A0A8H5ATP9_9AGAR|nr:hypothetical protein D9619_010282 [Psilocybe cf. subviscida]
MDDWSRLLAGFSLIAGLILAYLYYYGQSTGRQGKTLTDFFAVTGVAPPKPLPDFDVRTAKPRPYRPFRWAYHQTMALMPMDPDYWLELESTYHERIAQRLEIYRKNGKAVVDAMPGSELACQELMEMVIQYLCVRYPNSFSYDDVSGTFYNRILDTETPNVLEKTGVAALETVLENVPEDFPMMMKDEKGVYRLRCGITLSAIGWNMQQKMGKTMPEIHEPVPFYQEKLKSSIERYFSKLTCDKPIQRGSWGIEIGQPLYLQTTDPHWALRDKQDPALSVADLYLRVDWQTLRRLPHSRAIVFNYKALFTPVTQLRREPYIPRLVATVIKNAASEFLEYKAAFHTEHKLVPALEKWAKEQEDSGIVPRDWSVRTLDEHPFFPGWEELTRV